MQCPDCGRARLRKNGHRKGKQNHICADCRRQLIINFIEGTAMKSGENAS